MPRFPLPRGIVVVFAGATLACGSSSTSSSTAGLLDPSQPRTEPLVVITAQGVKPQQSHLDSPVTVTFRNDDTAAHEIGQAPELGYGACDEVDLVGRLEPGQSKTATITSGNRLCAYQDRQRAGVAAFQGILVVH